MTIEGKMIGYARVSRDDQNLDLQIDALLNAGIEKKNIFKEHVSALKKKRPQFELALKRCRKGDVLVVWKLDRFGRNMKQIVDTVADLNDRGVKIKSLTEHIDSQTPTGKFTYHIMAASAQLERDMIAERTKAGLAVAKKNGTWRSRPTKFSEEQWEELRVILINPDNADVNNSAIAAAVKGIKPNMVATYRKDLEKGMTYKERFPTGNVKIAKVKA